MKNRNQPVGQASRLSEDFWRCWLWQEEYPDRVIRNEKEFLEKVNYIANNPVKAHLSKGYEDYQWPYIENWINGISMLRSLSTQRLFLIFFSAFFAAFAVNPIKGRLAAISGMTQSSMAIFGSTNNWPLIIKSRWFGSNERPSNQRKAWQKPAVTCEKNPLQ